MCYATPSYSAECQLTHSVTPAPTIPIHHYRQVIRPHDIQAFSGRSYLCWIPVCQWIPQVFGHYSLSMSQFAISPAVDLFLAILSISATLVGEYSDFHLLTKSSFCFFVRQAKAALISALNLILDSYNCLAQISSI